MNDNNLESIQKLFNEKIFRIPDYQRGYSWNEQQLTEFWEDVLNIPQNREHYTGMISLKEIKDVSNTEKWNDIQWLIYDRGYKMYHIVDGQQRLTTIIILINEIVNFIKKLPENKGKTDEQINLNSFTLKMIKENYLVVVKPNSEEILKSYKFGYEVDNPSYKFFKNKILEAESQVYIEETFYTLNLEYAKEFFKKAINDLYEKNNKNIEIINRLFVNLTQKLKFNTYYIEDDFNVYIAFETMNNRGKRLSNLELLKNRLIYLTTLFKDDEAVKRKVREDINDTWKEIYSYLGKNKSRPLSDDEFLQAHWIIYFGYTRTNKDNYTNFLLKKYFTQKRVIDDMSIILREEEQKDEDFIILDDEEDISEEEIQTERSLKIDGKLKLKDISDYINSLRQLIPYWYDLYFPEQSNFSENIKLWLSKLNRIGYAYFKPLTCVVLSKKDINDNDKLRYLQLTERWIFLLFRLSGYFETFRNSFYYNLSKDLYANKENLEYVLRELDNVPILNESKTISIDGPMSKISRLFKNNQGYYKWNTIRYFLYEYELKLKGKTGTDIKLTPEAIFKKDEKDKVSIEHIYPQTGDNEYWLKRFGNYTDNSIHYISNSLGNLLPLSMSINSSFQNDSFDDKKNGTNNRERCYSNGCYSEMEVATYPDWNIETIKERGIELLDFMAERWEFQFASESDKERMLFLNDIEIDSNKKIDIPEEKYNNINEEISYLSKNSSIEVINIFNELHEYIMKLNNSINYSKTKNYISYNLGKVFVEVHFMSDFIKMFLMAGEYDDPKNMVEKLGENYNWTNNNRLDVHSKEEIDYAKNIIKQSFDKIR